MITLQRLLSLLFAFEGVMKRRTYAVVSLLCLAGLFELFHLAWPTVRTDALLNDPSSPDGFGLVGYWAFRPLAPVCLIWVFSAASFKRLKGARIHEGWLLAPLMIFIASLILIAFPRALAPQTQAFVTAIFAGSALALVVVWVTLLNLRDVENEKDAQQGYASDLIARR